MELNSTEKLAVAQALYKAIAEQVSTKNPDNLRGAADAEYRMLYETTGAKSFDVKLFGEKVGTYSITVTKAVPESVDHEFEVADMKALVEWDGGDKEALSRFMHIHWVEYAKWYFEWTGEMPPGCRMAERVTPATPGGEVSRTTLKIDGHAVSDVLGPHLGGVVMGLLEEGE